MSTIELRRFPSGRSIGNCRKDAKRLAREQKIPLHEAQNQVAKLNGIDLPWGLAIKETVAVAVTASSSQPIRVMSISDIQRVIADHPRVTHFGMGVPLHGLKNMEEHHAAILESQQRLLNAVDECNRACQFLAHVNKRKTLNPRAGSSYGLKHQTEGFLRTRPGAERSDCYVANGSFICAAIFLGFHYEVESYDSPNVHFNVSSRSPVFMWRKLKNKNPSSLYHPALFAKLQAYEKQLGIEIATSS